MQNYIALIKFTDQGMQSIKESPSRADAFQRKAEQGGLEVVAAYWTAGSHDGVLIFRAPDEVAASATMLTLARTGNVRTELLRAYDRREFESVLEKTV